MSSSTRRARAHSGGKNLTLDVTSLVVGLADRFSAHRRHRRPAWLLMRGIGFGLLSNIGIGIIGACVGGFLFSLATFSVEMGLN